MLRQHDSRPDGPFGVSRMAARVVVTEIETLQEIHDRP